MVRPWYQQRHIDARRFGTRLAFLFSVKNMISSAIKASLAFGVIVRSLCMSSKGWEKPYGTPTRFGLVDDKLFSTLAINVLSERKNWS